VSTAARGLAWCFVFVVIEAVQAVFFGGLFQRMDAFLIGSLVFGLTTIATLLWASLHGRRQLARAFAYPTALLGMNLTTAAGWIAYLVALQLVEPAVVFAIFSGMVPFAALFAARLGVAETSPACNRLEAAGTAILVLGMVILAAATLAGFSGFVRGGTSAAVAGIALAALSGALIAWMLFFCQRLERAGVGPIVQFGLRFLLYVPLSAAGAVLGLDAKGDATSGDVTVAVAAGLLLMAFPIYAMQKAVALVSPFTVAAVTALGPLFVFGFQLVEGRVDYAPATLFGLCVYFVGAIAAAVGSAGGHLAGRLSRQRRRFADDEASKLSGRYRRDIGLPGEDISAAVDRGIGRLGIDEFRSRG
jgi:drug/metabolite transporter (DMT)-like permease